MTLDNRLRDAMHEHVDGLQSPARTGELVDKLQRAHTRTQIRRTAGTVAAAVLVIGGVVALVGRQSNDSGITTVADESGGVQTESSVSGSVETPSPTTLPTGAVPGLPGTDPGAPAPSGPGGAVPPGPAPTLTPPAPGTAPLPGPSSPVPPTSVVSPPPTPPVPSPCTASAQLDGLLPLRFTASGRGEPGATITVSAVLGSQQATVDATGSWSTTLSLPGAVLPIGVTVSCSTGEVIPLTLLG